MMNEFSQSNCDNCGTPLEGEYCHCCGQRKIDFKTDWKNLTIEFFCSLINFDGKLLVGLAQLAFRPWRLIGNYIEGKRTSQIPPIRAYLFVSLIAFVAASGGFISGFKNGVAEASVVDEKTIAVEAEEVGSQEANEDVDRLLDTFFEWLPRVFLVGVFVLAWLIRIVFARNTLVYLECLVVAIYLQSFAFLWTSLVVGWGGLVELIHLTSGELLINAMLLWLLVCPVIAVQRVFHISYWKAIPLWMCVSIIYFCLLLGGIALLGFVYARTSGLI